MKRRPFSPYHATFEASRLLSVYASAYSDIQLKLFNNPTYKRVNFILAALIFLGQNIPESIRQVHLSLVVTIPPVPLPSIVIALKLDFGSIEPRFHRTTQNSPQARFISPVIKVIDKCIEAVKENPIEQGLHSFRDKVQEKP